MPDIIVSMNKVLDDWISAFEFIHIEPDMAFNEDEKGQLCFNGVALCPVEGLVLESSLFDAGIIAYTFSNNLRLTLAIDWPEDDTPYIQSVHLSYFFGNYVENYII